MDRVARYSEAVVTTLRSHCRRTGAESLKKSAGQRRGVERVTRWPRRQPLQVRQRARAPWVSGRISTGRSARGPRDTAFKFHGNVILKPQPPTWRGVGEEEPRSTVWGGAYPALAVKAKGMLTCGYGQVLQWSDCEDIGPLQCHFFTMHSSGRNVRTAPVASGYKTHYCRGCSRLDCRGFWRVGRI